MKPASVRVRTSRIGVFSDLKDDQPLAESASLLQALQAPPELYGDSVRQPNPWGDPKPNALLLIYYSPVSGEGPRIVRMFDSMVTDLDASEAALYALAKAGSENYAHIGSDFADLNWKHPTCISIVLDADDHEFFWFDPIGNDPIVFEEVKEKPVNGTIQTFHYEPNKSFYDAELRKLVDPDTKKERPLLRFVNHHRNGKGDPLKPREVANFCMDIKLLVGPKNGPVDIHIIDPDTQNQGPGAP